MNGAHKGSFFFSHAMFTCAFTKGGDLYDYQTNGI